MIVHIVFYNFIGLSLFQILRILPFSFLRYYPFRDNFRFSVRKALLGYCCILGAEIVAIYFYGNNIRPWGNMIFHILYILYSFVVVKADVYKQIFVIFLLALYQMSVTAIVLTFLNYGPFVPVDWGMGFLLYLLFMVLTFYPAFRFFKIRLTPFLKYEISIWRRLCLLPLLVYVMLLIYTPTTGSFTFHTVFMRVVASCLAFVGCLILINALAVMQKHQQLETDLRITKKLYQADKNKMLSMQEHLQEMRQLRHDIKHHLNYLSYNLQAGKITEATKYLHNMQVEYDQTLLPRVCENDAVDAVVQYWLKRMKTAEASITMQLQVPQALPIDSYDLSGILGNILENVYDATIRLPKGKGRASVKLKLRGNLLIIAIDNAFDGNFALKDGVYQSAKLNYELPGIGMQNIKRLTDKYQGEIKIAQKNDEFQVSIILKLPETKDDLNA